MLEEHQPNADQRGTDREARAVEIQEAAANYRAIASGRTEES